jgi:transketolase
MTEVPMPARPAGSVPAISGKDIRRIVLQQSYRAHVGHIGSALSIADLLAAIYGGAIRDLPHADPDRDRVILSKGHAALALYATLALRGWIPHSLLDDYCADESELGVHPEHALPGIDFYTGSLGQGLTFATGAALAARLQGSKRRTFALLSDAECNEGSTWEAAMFAGHHELGGLIVVLDYNGQQALGYTRDVNAATNMAERWQSFGWDAYDMDGHAVPALVDRLQSFDQIRKRPQIIVAHTTFGKGVSYMERKIRWHYMPMSEAEYELALSEVEDA